MAARRIVMRRRLLVGSATVIATAGVAFSGLNLAMAGPRPTARPASRGAGSLPRCNKGDDPISRLAPDALSGPAAGTVADGMVTTSWNVDHSKLLVNPPVAGDVATVTHDAAACNLISGFTPNNFPLNSIVGTGSVLGLGRLTISPKVHSDLTASDGRHASGGLPAYNHRLAWILTVSFAAPSSCPRQPTDARAPRLANSRSWLYEVFAIDATTGGAGIEYTERTPEPCGGAGSVRPSISDPAQAVSLPWHPISVNRRRTHGELAVRYPSCPLEAADDVVNVDRDSHRVDVTAIRNFGPACGEPRRHVINLEPATVGQKIPRHLSHAPVGAIDDPTNSY